MFGITLSKDYLNSCLGRDSMIILLDGDRFGVSSSGFQEKVFDFGDLFGHFWVFSWIFFRKNLKQQDQKVAK